MTYVLIVFGLALSLGSLKGYALEGDKSVFSERIVVSFQEGPGIIVSGTRLKIQKKKVCTLIKSKDLNDEMDFLNSNVGYFSIDKIIPKLLESQKYYQAILQNTHFLEFEENSFTKKNSVFSLKKRNVKNYGECYIGQYYFPTSANSGQVRVTIIINPERREVSIWNFDNLQVSKTGLDCDFSTRGSHVVYKMVYAGSCSSFIPKHISP